MVDSKALRERRALNRGFGAALNNAFEIAMIPALFAGFGWLIDRLVGTLPVFTVVVGLVGLVGTFLKLYYAYVREMAQHDAAGAWNRPSEPAP